MKDFSKQLYQWFQAHQRDLPWRKNKTPYSVWVSEVMLQQTQASVVIPYFLNWLKLFPTITDLANADLKVVIKAWEGLGYYQRVRNLHAGARQVLEEFQGNIPSNYHDLKRIKGIGSYTASAILTFAYGQQKAAVDGNVKRFFSRLYRLEKGINSLKTTREIEKLADHLVQQVKEPISEALIEFPAMVCKKKPACDVCSLKVHCKSYQNNVQHLLPIKGTQIQYINLKRKVYLFEAQGALLLKFNQNGLMRDLYEFPYEDQNVADSLISHLDLQGSIVAAYDTVHQSFTKYRVKLRPYHIRCSEQKLVQGYEWISIEEVKQLAFSSGHRKILLKYLRARS